jgi:hypothetical protein
MSVLNFEALERELKAAGAAPNIIARTLLELREHCADIEAAAIERGMSAEQARARAIRRLGTSAAIVAEIRARRELLDWRHRWPHSARCVDSISYCLAWPVAPFVYCATHPAGIVRWGVSSGLGACITACILLTLNWITAFAV